MPAYRGSARLSPRALARASEARHQDDLDHLLGLLGFHRSLDPVSFGSKLTDAHAHSSRRRKWKIADADVDLVSQRLEPSACSEKRPAGLSLIITCSGTNFRSTRASNGGAIICGSENYAP